MSSLVCPEDDPAPDPDIAIRVMAAIKNLDISAPIGTPGPMKMILTIELERVPPELFAELRRRRDAFAPQRRIAVIFPPDDAEAIGPGFPG